jgi:hypothetical protein
VSQDPGDRDEQDGRPQPSRRAFLHGVFAVSLASYAKLSGAPRVARYAERALGRKRPGSEPEPPTLTCEPIDHCGACACAGDRYRCTCSDGSLSYKTCATDHVCDTFSLDTCDQTVP